MLKLILNLFRTPQPTTPTIEPDPKWTEYKKHLAAAHAMGRYESRVGPVQAINDIVDRRMGEEFRAVLMLFFACLFITFTTTTDMMGQEIHHAPTAEQCRADIAVWKNASPAQNDELPFTTLVARAEELGDCGDVLVDAHDHIGWQWTQTLTIIYLKKILSHETLFIDRHGLEKQFYDEDAKGAR